MNPTPPLTGSHLRTYNTLFQHPVSHNLAWRDVHALFRHLGHVDEEANGNLKVTRNGETLVLRPSTTKDVAETDELMRLRHFLERSEPAPSIAAENGAHWLLVIDHHEARIFRTESPGSTTLQILPPRPGEYFRHEHHSKDFAKGEEKPDPNTFFEPVVRALKPPGAILIFGTGTGNSSEMDQFVKWSRIHHPELAKRIVGSMVVDEHHLSEGEILAKAREFYTKSPVAPA